MRKPAIVWLAATILAGVLARATPSTPTGESLVPAEKVAPPYSVAGESTVGSATQATAGLREVASFWGESSEDVPLCGVMDGEGGRALLAMAGSPPKIVKLRLGDEDTYPRRVGALLLGTDDGIPQCAVLDVADGCAYFGTSSSPARIVKVALGAGDELPTRVSALTLDAGENDLRCAVVDAANGHAFFGTYTVPGRVVKVALGNSVARLGAVTLLAGEDNLRCATINAAAGYACFGTYTTPGQLVKIGLGAGSAPPTRSTALALQSGESSLGGAAFDPVANAVYLATQSGIRLVMVSTGTAVGSAMQRRGAVVLDSQTERLYGDVALDPVERCLYVGAGPLFRLNRMVKFELQGPTTLPVRAGYAPIPQGGSAAGVLLFDPHLRRLHMTVEDYPSAVHMLPAEPRSVPMSRLGAGETTADAQAATSVIDAVSGYAYVFNTKTPAVLAKVALGDGTNPPEEVASLELPAADGSVRCAVIDAAAGYLYAGTFTDPGRVVKIALGAGDDAPTRVGALVLPEGERSLTGAGIDTAHGFAYFSNASTFIKVTLGEGDALPTRVGRSTGYTAGSSGGDVALDLATGYGYCSFGGSPAKLGKFVLGVGNAEPKMLGTVSLASGEDTPRSIALDPLRGNVYIGVSTTPASVVKFAVGAGNGLPTRVGATALAADETSPYGMVIDPAAGFLCVGASTIPGKIVKLALGSPGGPAARIESLTLPSSERGIRAAVLQADAGHAWFVSSTLDSRMTVVKIAVGDAGTLPTVVSSLRLDSGESRLSCSAALAEDGIALFASGTVPSKVMKVAVGAPEDEPVILSSTLLDEEDSTPACIVADPEGGHAYLGMQDRVVKVAIGEGSEPPVRVGAGLLSANDGGALCGVLHHAAGHAWFGTDESPAKVLKFSLGADGAPPERVAELVLEPGEAYLGSALIDPAGEYAWFGTSADADTPARVVKIALGTGDDAPRRVGALVLDDADGHGLHTAVIVPSEGHGFFMTRRGRFIKVMLGEGEDLPTPVSYVPEYTSWLPGFSGGFADLDANLAFFTDTIMLAQPGADTSTTVHKYGLTGGGAAPKSLGTLRVAGTDYRISGAIDASSNRIVVAAGTNPTKFLKLAYGHAGILRATRFQMPVRGLVEDVRFYRHYAGGNLRLSLYAEGEPKQLVWESEGVESTGTGEIVVPIAAGTPAELVLEPGTYWAAWQSDRDGDVGSWRQTIGDSGFRVAHDFGPSPESIAGDVAIPTSDLWTEYITYRKIGQSWWSLR